MSLKIKETNMDACLCPNCGKKEAVCYCKKTRNANFSGYQVEYDLICTNCGEKRMSKHNFILSESIFFHPLPRCPWCHKSLKNHANIHNHKESRLLAHYF